MSDLFIYIIVGLELILSFVYFWYVQLHHKNGVIVKKWIGILYFGLISGIIVALFFVASKRTLSGTVFDIILSCFLYLLCATLVISFFYLSSIRFGFEGLNLVKYTIFKKTHINVHCIKETTNKKEKYTFSSLEERIVFESKFFQNAELILKNVDLE